MNNQYNLIEHSPDTLVKQSILFVTIYAKRGLPHITNLPTLTIDNVRLVNATDLKFGQQELPT